MSPCTLTTSLGIGGVHILAKLASGNRWQLFRICRVFCIRVFRVASVAARNLSASKAKPAKHQLQQRTQPHNGRSRVLVPRNGSKPDDVFNRCWVAHLISSLMVYNKFVI